MRFKESPIRGGWRPQPPINDKDLISEAGARNLTRDVCIKYSSLRERFGERKADLDSTFAAKDLEVLVGTMVDIFAINPGILKRIGTSGKIDSFALIDMSYLNGKVVNSDMVFKMDRATLFSSPKEVVLYAIAHELSHLRFGLDQFRHGASEFATDVLAVLIVSGDPKFSIEKAVRQYGDLGTTHYGYIKDEFYPIVFDEINNRTKVIHL